MKKRTARLAPTPSGYLHAGNAANFLLNARLAGPEGRLYLRIDDLDRGRFRDEYLDDIFRVIDRLGVNVTDGPTDPEDFEKRWTQLHRLPEYHDALSCLKKSDRLFACPCSRKELYDGRHAYGCLEGKVDPEEESVAWRINARGLPPVVIPDLIREKPFVIDIDATMRDFAVQRKDGTPAYQLACTVDDVLYGINTVGRGQDLLPSTAAQALLSDLIGYPLLFGRVDFLHHPLIGGPDGEKLSKSAGAAGISGLGAAFDLGELTALVNEWLAER